MSEADGVPPAFQLGDLGAALDLLVQLEVPKDLALGDGVGADVVNGMAKECEDALEGTLDENVLGVAFAASREGGNRETEWI